MEMLVCNTGRHNQRPWNILENPKKWEEHQLLDVSALLVPMFLCSWILGEQFLRDLTMVLIHREFLVHPGPAAAEPGDRKSPEELQTLGVAEGTGSTWNQVLVGLCSLLHHFVGNFTLGCC